MDTKPNTMKLILVATRTGKEVYIKTDLDTEMALLRFKMQTGEVVRHFNDDYCGAANEATHYNYLYLSTDVDEPSDLGDEFEPGFEDYYEPQICNCCGGSGYI